MAEPFDRATSRSASRPGGQHAADHALGREGKGDDGAAAARAASHEQPPPAPPAPATRLRPRRPAGDPTPRRPTPSSATQASPSKIRSTAMDDSAALKRTPARRVDGEDPDQLARAEGQDVVRHEPDGDRMPEREPPAAARRRRAAAEAPADQADGEGERGDEDGEQQRAELAPRACAGATRRGEPRAAPRAGERTRPLRRARPARIRRGQDGAVPRQRLVKRQRDEVDQLLDQRPEGGDVGLAGHLRGDALPDVDRPAPAPSGPR